MKAELLLAWEDRTWTTAIYELGDKTSEELIREVCEKNRGLIGAYVYSIPPTEQDDSNEEREQ